MSSNEHAERLARALGSLRYVEPVSWEGTDFGTIKVLCRVQPNCLNRWAKLVESVLRTAQSREKETDAWDSHICRLYMLKNNQLVYGWLVAITSPYMEDSLSVLIPTIKAHAPQARPSTSYVAEPVITAQKEAPRKDPSAPRRVLSVPEADARGNPIVPDSHKVTTIPMAGLHPGHDRNAPSDRTEGKGAYGMFKSKRWGDAFKPPNR